MASPMKLHLCYMSGLDLRRVHLSTTPFLAEAITRYPFVELRNAPSNELFPTLATGRTPPDHGVWGVRLAPPRRPRLRDRFVDALPALVTTTGQCARHWWDRRYDLAAVPPRRRRRLELTRTKYKRRTRSPEALYNIHGTPTLLDAVGPEHGRYLFSASYQPERDVLPRVARDDLDLEVLELYSLDRHQQWNLDRPSETLRFYAVIDRFLEQLAQRAADRGIGVMIVSDHGHDPIRESVDLFRLLGDLGIGPRHADWFVEVSSARFWLHDEGARRVLREALEGLGKGALVTWQEMRMHGIRLEDASFGEMFYWLDPGKIFFPHDFYQPFANLWLGLSDPLQRSRLSSPRHRGNHGHLPHFDVERSFVLLLDERWTALRPKGRLVDVAPSIMEMLGRKPFPSMDGQPLFAPA